jgi:hypothetical protein
MTGWQFYVTKLHLLSGGSAFRHAGSTTSRGSGLLCRNSSVGVDLLVDR